jgi:peptide/nickel transport system permease protein
VAGAAVSGARVAAGRVVTTAIAALAAYVLAWAIAELAPGSAGERAARAAGVLPPDDAAAGAVRAALIARAEERFDLGGGARDRVARAAGRALRLDAGTSWRDGAPVAARIGPALGHSAAVAIPALVLAVIAGVAAGAGRRRRSAPVLAVAVALALAMPPAWVAQLVLGAGAGGALAAAAVLALAPAAVIAAHVRAAQAGFLASAVATAVRARGVGDRRLAWHHGLRLAVASLAPLAASTAAYLVGATAVVERAFGRPGIGRLALDAAATGDVPVLAAVAAIAAAIIAGLTGLADLAARAADPRLAEAP